MANNSRGPSKRKYSGEDIEAVKQKCNTYVDTSLLETVQSLTLSSLTFGPTIDIFYNDEKFIVEKSLICNRSRLLRTTHINEVAAGKVTLEGMSSHNWTPTNNPAEDFLLYLRFIHQILPSKLPELVSASYISASNHKFQKCTESESLLWLYSRCWRMGHFLGDDAYSNAAMDCMLEAESSPKNLIAMISRNSVQHFLGEDRDIETGSALWCWMVDCIVSELTGSHVDGLWAKVAVRQDFAQAVVKELAEGRGGKLETSMIGNREAYMVREAVHGSLWAQRTISRV